MTASASQEPDPEHGDRETSHAEIEPHDVFSRVAMVRAELELIRFEMGKPTSVPLKLSVRGAAPREDYFQALTLLLKSNRLCFEQTREDSTPPKAPTGEIKPAHAFELVTEALKLIRKVKSNLGITNQSPEPTHDETSERRFSVNYSSQSAAEPASRPTVCAERCFSASYPFDRSCRHAPE